MCQYQWSSPTDTANDSISLDRNVLLAKETSFCRQAKISPTVRSEFKSTNKTPKVIIRQDCLSPTNF